MISDIKALPSVQKPWLKYYSKEALNTPLEPCGMFDFMYNSNIAHPNATALNYFGRKMSFAEFFELIDSAAKSFKALGIKEGDIVTVVSLTCVPAVVSMYALNKLGAAPNFLNVLSTVADFEEFFKEAESKLVLSLDLFCKNVLPAAKAAGVERVISFSLASYMPPITALGFGFKMRKFDKSVLQNPLILPWEDFLTAGRDEPETDFVRSGRELAVLGHTGGTTGTPKGVLLADHSFNLVAHYYNLCMAHEVGDVFLSVMIPYVVYSLMINIHMPLCLGFETVLVPKFDPGEWHKYIKKYKPQHCGIIPAYASPILNNEKLDKMDLGCLRTIGMGGDGMNIPLETNVNAFMKKHGSTARLRKGYGMTEVCATATTEFDYAYKIGSVGIPLPENNLMICRLDTYEECGFNESGEICMQCSSRMIGYMGHEDEMNNLFRTHPDGSVWIHTGDLGYIDEDGFLFLEGRLKRMIMTVIDGKVYKIFPSKVEEVLSLSEGVHEACVVCAHDGTNQVLKAFIIRQPDCTKTDLELTEELNKLCRDSLPENMHPYFYEFCKDYPRTPAGKIDYRALED